jgi:hypothetical protein
MMSMMSFEGIDLAGQKKKIILVASNHQSLTLHYLFQKKLAHRQGQLTFF